MVQRTFQEIILSSNNPTRALFYSNIFEEDHKKLGFLYKYATNTLNMNPDDLSINQLLQLLNVSATGDFQTFLDEEFNNQVEIEATLDTIEGIIQNTYLSNNSVDYANFLYEIDSQIFSKVPNLYKVIQSMSNEYIEVMNSLKLERPDMMDVNVPSNIKGLTVSEI